MNANFKFILKASTFEVKTLDSYDTFNDGKFKINYNFSSIKFIFVSFKMHISFVSSKLELQTAILF